MNSLRYQGKLFAAVIFTCGFANLCPIAFGQTFGNFTLEPTGATGRVNYYRPVKVPLQTTKPASVKQEPTYLGTPRYGLLHMGNGPRSLHVLAIDEPTNGPARIYVDLQGDGDLTSSGDGAWAKQQSSPRKVYGENRFLLRSSYGTPQTETSTGSYGIMIYRFPDEVRYQDWVLIYRDADRRGMILIDGQSLQVLIVESDADGLYDKPLDDDEKPLAGAVTNPVELLIDQHGDGKWSEPIDLRSPFMLSGKRYVANLAPDGSALTLAPTTRPLPVRPYIESGDWKQSQDDLAGAIADYDQAILLKPNLASTYSKRGRAKHRKNDLSGAMSDYGQAISLGSTDASAYHNRGLIEKILYDRDGSHDHLNAAIADYDHAIALNPMDATTFLHRGKAKVAKNDTDGAMVDYDQAIALDGKYVAAYGDRAILKIALFRKSGALENLDGAIADYDQAIALDPQNAATNYFNRGNAKRDRNDLSEAINDYTQAIALNPKDAGSYTNRGNIKSRLGDSAGAIADHDRAIALNPRLVEAYLGRGDDKRQSHDLAGAVADYSRGMAIAPGDARFPRNRGLTKDIQGDFAGARSDYMNFLNLDPNLAYMRFRLVLVLRRQKEDETPAGLPEAVAELDDEWTKRVGQFLLGATPEADFLQQASQQTVDADSAQCEAYYYAGMQRLLQGESEPARHLFEQCVATKSSQDEEYELAQAELARLP
jgi:tetratricopeptide (TPR) repeat protein